MKIFLVSLLIILSLFSLVACGEKKPPVVVNEVDIDVNKSMEEVVEDDMDNSAIFMENLKVEVAIFGDIEEKEFIWRTENGQITINGKELKTSEKSTDSDKVMPFFKEQWFIEDMWNIADGTISYAVWYKKENTVCTMVVDLGEDHDMFSEAPSTADVTVNCGILD